MLLLRQPLPTRVTREYELWALLMCYSEVRLGYVDQYGFLHGYECNFKPGFFIYKLFNEITALLAITAANI